MNPDHHRLFNCFSTRFSVGFQTFQLEFHVHLLKLENFRAILMVVNSNFIVDLGAEESFYY